MKHENQVMAENDDAGENARKRFSVLSTNFAL